ncbi:MAG TPA: hypothetical protein VFV23_06130 [Verrucomicrobiae bacterium]|nr:hypothetical protein [Verrucomicrobiae bacterium]
MKETTPTLNRRNHDLKIVWLLCILATLHIFIFSAAFPFDNNMDEAQHFDLVVRYAHGDLPRGLETMGEESSKYFLTFGSPEYTSPPGSFTNGIYPTPFWLHRVGTPEEKTLRAAAYVQASKSWGIVKKLPKWTNYESSEQPLYYIIAGAWWNLGEAIGLDGLHLLYWLRFLNILFVLSAVVVASIAAKLAFPENKFIQFSVPAIIAFLPQFSFYSIENDVASPLAIGIVLIALIKFWRAEIPDPRCGIFLGSAMAASFLVKLSNAPMLAVAGAIVFWKLFQIARNAKLRAAIPSFIAWFLCAAIPVGAWLAWTKYAFGDFTGTAAKLQFITWTPKPFLQWWHHPIFSPAGIWTFLSETLVMFWQGDLHWAGSLFDRPFPDAIYVLLSISFVSLALLQLRRATPQQRPVLFWSLAFLAANAAFFIYLSIRYDFGICPYPSKEHPFFVAGRLILGMLIPFLLLFQFGMHSLLRDLKTWIQFAALGAFLLFMLISEIVTDWPVFHSQYNWYHM